MARVPALVAILALAGSIPALAQDADATAGAGDDASAAAEPEEPSEYARDGFYLMGSIAGASYTGLADEAKQRATTQSGVVAGATVDSAAGFNFRAGYRFHPRIAAEGQFEWLTPVRVDITGNAAQSAALRVNAWSFMVNGKGYILTGKIQPFLSVGMGMIMVDVNDRGGLDLRNDDTGFALRMGGGFDFYITPKWLIELDLSYVLPTAGTAPFDYISAGVGVGYRF
jgi:opacity protein-like surface antigen